MKEKTTAAILAIVLGSFGIHKFYLNRPGQGFLYFLFSWTGIPFLLGLAEGVVYLTMDEQRFDMKYNYKYLQPAYQARQITAKNPTLPKPKKYKLSDEQMEQLRGMKGLLDDGAVTQEEYNEIKAKILGTKGKDSYFDF